MKWYLIQTFGYRVVSTVTVTKVIVRDSAITMNWLSKMEFFGGEEGFIYTRIDCDTLFE